MSEQKNITEQNLSLDESTSKFCSVCGSKENIEATVCSSCGVEFSCEKSEDDNDDKAKTKKVIIIVAIVGAALVALFAIFGGLSSDSDASGESGVYDEIVSVIESRAITYCIFNYADVKNTLVTVTTYNEATDGEYIVYGYVTVINNYGERYKGNFDAVVKIDELGDGICTSFDLETPRKE